jgi:branched-chain amino acid transport system permease protein
LRAFSIPPEIQWVIYGALMILIVYFLPEGIVPALSRCWRGRHQQDDAAALALKTEPSP